jgi:hypothetical protein
MILRLHQPKIPHDFLNLELLLFVGKNAEGEAFVGHPLEFFEAIGFGYADEEVDAFVDLADDLVINGDA